MASHRARWRATIPPRILINVVDARVTSTPLHRLAHDRDGTCRDASRGRPRRTDTIPRARPLFLQPPRDRCSRVRARPLCPSPHRFSPLYEAAGRCRWGTTFFLATAPTAPCKSPGSAKPRRVRPRSPVGLSARRPSRTRRWRASARRSRLEDEVVRPRQPPPGDITVRGERDEEPERDDPHDHEEESQQMFHAVVLVGVVPEVPHPHEVVRHQRRNRPDELGARQRHERELL